VSSYDPFSFLDSPDTQQYTEFQSHRLAVTKYAGLFAGFITEEKRGFMGRIISAKAYANNEVAFVAWTLDGTIEGCLGFEINRVYIDTNEVRGLAVWVPFKGQSNPKWLPQTTSVWPIQKLIWRDLTVRKRRDSTNRRPADVRVKYRIRPLVPAGPGLEPVAVDPNANPYDGAPVPLAYADKAVETNEVMITTKHGDIRSTFSNGILSAQWLSRALEQGGEAVTPDVLLKHIQKEGDKIRAYLTGDVLGMLRELLERAGADPGAQVRLALYELSDKELKDTLVANKQCVRLILSNTGLEGNPPEWDATNKDFRAELHNTPGLEIHDRMFNNGRIGHNKFAVLIGGDGTPQAVMTGSTNWTPNGLCAQSNNAAIIESKELAKIYSDYWDQLLEDTKSFKAPQPPKFTTLNAQGPAIRSANAKPTDPIVLDDGTILSHWYSPNTKNKTKKDVTPPDLMDVYARMQQAEEAILFAVFLPSRSGRESVIEQALKVGQAKPKVLVYGAVSDPTAMPNYVPPPKTGPKPHNSATYDEGNIHVVRAAALTKSDIVGSFEAELLKAGHAIIHDKIVVVDPLSPKGFVVFGSHNLGYKASYENDENLVIAWNNSTLIEAYAVHVLDLYDHYRYRAVLQDLEDQHQASTAGFLSLDSKWLDTWVKSDKGNLARYLAG
jgi:hypothetical protein